MVEPHGSNLRAARNLEPYTAYKDSGIEWLGEIPSHWEVRRLKRICTIVNGGTPKTSERRYWNGPIVWITPDDLGRATEMTVRESSRTVTSAGLESCGAQMVPAGSLVLSTRAPIGHLAVAGTDLCTNQGCRSLVFRNPESSRYTFYQLAAARGMLQSLGVGSTFRELSSVNLGALSVSAPPSSEQCVIADFLDRETVKIDAVIGQQRKLIDLLQEQRAAIISHVVTKGLDPSAPMKDSGVEWLGKIPAHWEVVQLRRVTFDRCDGPFGSGLKSTHYAEDGVRVVRLQNIGHSEFEGADAAFIPHEHYLKLGDHSVLPGDLLIAGLGDANHPAGRACVAPADIGSAMVKADCFRFRLDHSRAQPSFLALQLSATAGIASGLMSTGATRQRTSLASTAARAIAIPDPQEQSRIVDYVTRQIVWLDHAQHAAQRAIDQLNEYRSALISSVVTGKIDVHNHLQSETAPNTGRIEDVP